MDREIFELTDVFPMYLNPSNERTLYQILYAPTPVELRQHVALGYTFATFIERIISDGVVTLFNVINIAVHPVRDNKGKLVGAELRSAMTHPYVPRR